MNTRRCLILLVLATVLARPDAGAVIVATGDGTQNTTDPGTGVPWDHVGLVGAGTGVYLGDYGGEYWVLTAAHITPGNFTLGSTTYTYVTGSNVRVLNGDNSVTDLYLFRIQSTPSLSNLLIDGDAPSVGTDVTMIGGGRNRATTQTTWYVDTTPATWVWNTSPFSGWDSNGYGYTWASGRTKRWGTNTVDASSLTISYGYGNVTSFYTDFDQASDQAQGATGDSGGAVFSYNGSAWELTGIMVTIAGYSGQPSETAVFGNATYSVQLSAYRSFILATIPEPASASALGGILALLAAHAIRRRSRNG